MTMKQECSLRQGYMQRNSAFDAARGALRGLQQPEGYDEPELLAFHL